MRAAEDASKLRSEDDRKLKDLIAADTARREAVRAAEAAKKLRNEEEEKLKDLRAAREDEEAAGAARREALKSAEHAAKEKLKDIIAADTARREAVIRN